MRKALGIAAIAGLFLLLLSALVVTSPQEGMPARRMEPPTVPPDAAVVALASPDGTLAVRANPGPQGTRMDARLDAPPMDGLKRQPEGRHDANVTTIIAAVVLLFYGTGSVQGFATTLLLGVITSMITAIVVTRFLLTRFVRVFHEPRLFVAVKPAADAAVEGEAK